MTITEEFTPAVTEPGVYELSDTVYHADPVPGGSLSSTGARKLLPPSCPALFHYERHNRRREPNPAFDFGHAAHKLVLGEGPELVILDATDFRTKAAREQRDAAYAAGAVPLLPSEYQQVQDMAAVLAEHPVAKSVFSPQRGDAEKSLFWVDERTGTWCRARPDHMPSSTDGRLVIADYKTTQSADPDKISKSVHEYGYHVQAAWYCEGAKALGLAGGIEPAFVFVFQEKKAPYLVTVVELDAMAMRIGNLLARKALDTYAQCRSTGRWPGYSDEVELLSLPLYVERQHEEQM